MSTEPVTLSPESVDAIARRVVELQGLVSPGPVLTVAEACQYVRVGSQSSLDRWVSRFAPNARCGNGRYTRAALAKGREVEARQFAPARPKRKAANQTERLVA